MQEKRGELSTIADDHWICVDPAAFARLRAVEPFRLIKRGRDGTFNHEDANGDNKVSAQEFHKAMKVLALDAPKATVDAMFSAIDKDRSGAIDYNV